MNNGCIEKRQFLRQSGSSFGFVIWGRIFKENVKHPGVKQSLHSLISSVVIIYLNQRVEKRPWIISCQSVVVVIRVWVISIHLQNGQICIIYHSPGGGDISVVFISQLKMFL